MTRVPYDRYGHREALRTGRKKAIIVGGVPIPAGEDAFPGSFGKLPGFLRAEVGNEVDGETELVRALERSRFRNAFGDKLTLPHRRAECLEDFEAGLRAAGLMSVNEILVQSGNTGRKFRIAKRHVAVDGHYTNSVVDEPFPVGNAPQHSAVVTGGEGRARPAWMHSKNARRARF